MNDVLMASAEAYRRLTTYEYKITAGRKGNTIDVMIRFPEDAYHHLAGFQYARIEALRQQKNSLQCIIDGRITHADLQASGFQHWDRLEGIAHLQNRLESNQVVFRYYRHESGFSHIQADYLFMWENMVFFTADDKPVSLFENKRKADYSRGCPRYTILKIIRQTKPTNESVTVYER